MFRRSFLASAVAFVIQSRSTSAKELGLRRLATSKSFRFGSAIDPDLLDLPEAVSIYRDMVNSLTPRNQLKWTATERAPGKFTFEKADRIVDFAERNNMSVYGHTLIWYRVPSWVQGIDDRAGVRRAMQRHIEGVVGHYKGRIDAWDVVNEPFEYDSDKLRASVFQTLLGEEHIGESFHIARAVDERAVLVLNETHLEKGGAVYDAKREAVLALLRRLRQAGVPIDAVGLQSHFRPGTDVFDPKATADFCREVKQMGLGLYITELDASCRAVKRVKGFDDGSYAAVFGDVVTVVSENGDLRGVTVWGLLEKYAAPEKKGSGNLRCNKRVNLFDGNNQPRSSIEGLRRALEEL